MCNSSSIKGFKQQASNILLISISNKTTFAGCVTDLVVRTSIPVVVASLNSHSN